MQGSLCFLEYQDKAIHEYHRYMLDSYIIENSDRYQDSHMMVTGEINQEFVLLVIGEEEVITFYFFDISKTEFDPPKLMKFNSKTQEFNYFLSLKGFNHRYFMA
jgi:hypothetical protein